MPRYPDTVRVKLSGSEVEWPVVGMRECLDCAALIFFADTGNVNEDGKAKTMPVDVEPDEEGLHHPHWESCSNPQRFRRKQEARR